MHAGHYISGTGHLALIGWVLLGGVFSSEPPPFEMTEVSVISGADFDAMMAAQQPPSSATDVAQPAPPEVTPETPEVAATQDTPVETPDPPQTQAPQEDPAPEVTELTPPPDAEVSDVAPELDQPVGEQAVLVPEIAPQAVPRPVERVAPQAVAQPDPDSTPSEVEQAAVAPDEAGETPQEASEAQAPEEATTEIVTEATTAPKASSRPPGRRPAAPEPQVAETSAPAETAQSGDAINDAILDVLGDAEATAENVSTPTPSGPPLSQGERDALKVAVARCWNVGTLSSEATQTIVVVSMQMNQNATPVTGSIKMDSYEGGSSASARRVYDAARRAIIRCGADGFNLPQEKYSQWQRIEMTFDPRKMGVN